MDIQAEKIKLMKLLLDTDSEEIISQIKSVFTRQEYDFYDDLPEHVKESIDRGLKDVEEGRVRDHESVMHDIKIKYGIKD
jgi:predicted transcriptional regulator